MQEHINNVKEVQQQIMHFRARGEKVKIYHGSTHSTRAQRFDKNKFIDVSRFDRIIEINTAEQYVLVEPNVPMDALVSVTLRYNLVPPVVMEFPGITVGGAIQGGAGESSSFRYGLFHDTCHEYEIVLGNGEIVTASPTLNSDLFYGTACSYGSLGIITLIKLRLVPAKRYVHLTYRKVTSFNEAISLMQKNVTEQIDFVDGILFAKDRGVIMTGKLSEKRELPVSTFRGRSDEWFYLHADKISSNHDIYEEQIPVEDYLFRYDRGSFWGGRYAFTFFKIPFTRLTRNILNRGLKTRALHRLLHATNMSQQYFLQDLSVPEESATQLLRFLDKELHIYPLWLCPLKPGGEDKLSPNCLETNLVINVGVWGEYNKGYDQFVQINREVENKVMELHGRKVLYAHAYYTRDEFWKVYDNTWYTALRDKYFANAIFPDVYEKTKVVTKYKPSIFVGIWRALRSPKLPVS